MVHEKIIRRLNGSRVKIMVTFNHYEPLWEYELFVHCGQYGWPWYPTEEKAATPDEIHQAKLELWEKIKPPL